MKLGTLITTGSTSVITGTYMGDNQVKVSVDITNL